MNNEDFIQREAALVIANTDYLYVQALSINPRNANAIKKLAEEVLVAIQQNNGQEFINFDAATRLAIPTIVVEVVLLQDEAKV